MMTTWMAASFVDVLALPHCRQELGAWHDVLEILFQMMLIWLGRPAHAQEPESWAKHTVSSSITSCLKMQGPAMLSSGRLACMPAIWIAHPDLLCT